MNNIIEGNKPKVFCKDCIYYNEHLFEDQGLRKPPHCTNPKFEEVELDPVRGEIRKEIWLTKPGISHPNSNMDCTGYTPIPPKRQKRFLCK